MTSEIKTMIIVLVVCVIILFGGAWIYQKTVPTPVTTPSILTSHQEALVRDDSIKVVAPHQKLVVVEFADYECPACAYIAPKVKEFMNTYKDNVTFVFRNFPLNTIHPNAMISAEMARIAGEQGKYWEMHDQLFTNQAEWGELSDPSDVFVSYAKKIGMDASNTKAELAKAPYADKINADEKDGVLVGVDSTPTFFVGNTIIRTADPVALKKAIDDALASTK